MITDSDTAYHGSLFDYGSTFQYKLILNLLSDRSFLSQIHDILDYNYFSSNANKWIVKKISQHYEKYNVLPKLDNFKLYINNELKDNDLLKVGVTAALKEVYKYINSDDADFIKEQTIDFFKHKNFEKILLEATDLLKEKDYDTIKAKIDEATLAGSERDLGIDYKKDVDLRYSEIARQPIPTGWPPIDHYLDGGVSAGELAVFLGISSVGKSWLLEHLSINAMKLGYEVMFYTLEDSGNFVGTRNDSVVTGINTTLLKYNIDKIKNDLNKNFPGNMTIRSFPSEITNIHHIQAHYNKLLLVKKKIDIVFIDYGDIMAPLKAFKADWLNQRQIFNEIKSFAQINKVPVWTAAQASKDAADQYAIESTAVAQSYPKVAPCNIIISLSRNTEDKIINSGRLHLAKNKYGPDGITFPCKIDFERGIFKPMDPHTKEAKELNNKMKNGGEIIREHISDKIREMPFYKKD